MHLATSGGHICEICSSWPSFTWTILVIKCWLTTYEVYFNMAMGLNWFLFLKASIWYQIEHRVNIYWENYIFVSKILCGCNTRGGFSLTNGIRGCSKVLRTVHFGKFWYIDGWVIAYCHIPNAPNLQNWVKIGCILENLAKKAPNLPQIGCFLQKNGIEMGHKITLFEV